jgi:hypothetical protein
VGLPSALRRGAAAHPWPSREAAALPREEAVWRCPAEGVGRGVAPGSPSFARRARHPGNQRAHGHFGRGPVVTFGGYGFGSYGYYDYPYYYDDTDCWQFGIVRGRYRRLWVCD